MMQFPRELLTHRSLPCGVRLLVAFFVIAAMTIGVGTLYTYSQLADNQLTERDMRDYNIATKTCASMKAVPDERNWVKVIHQTSVDGTREV